jgi:hypothetical protein
MEELEQRALDDVGLPDEDDFDDDMVGDLMLDQRGQELEERI